MARYSIHNGNIHFAVKQWVDGPNKAEALYGHISSWDTSEVTDMSGLFRYERGFNEDLSGWNTSGVTSLRETFYRAESFDQDLSSWDVRNVENMIYTFGGAIKFNGNIQNWNTASVTTMKGMFYEAESFDQDLSGWDVSRVQMFTEAFAYAYQFTGHGLSSWDFSAATSMKHMFLSASLMQETICLPSSPNKEMDVTGLFCGSQGQLNQRCYVPSPAALGVCEEIVTPAEETGGSGVLGDATRFVEAAGMGLIVIFLLTLSVFPVVIFHFKLCGFKPKKQPKLLATEPSMQNFMMSPSSSEEEEDEEERTVGDLPFSSNNSIFHHLPRSSNGLTFTASDGNTVIADYSTVVGDDGYQDEMSVVRF